MYNKNYNSSDYDNYNFQGKLIVNLADSLFDLEDSLAMAYEEKPSQYQKSLSELRIFMDKVIGMELKFAGEDLKFVEKCLYIAKLNFNDNTLFEGAKYLSMAYQKICNILKKNDMMFPKNRRVTSFKEWTQNQLD